MSETIAVIVFIILAVLFYKMIGRYIGIPLICGVVGAAIGAIFGSNGTWMNYAYGGAIAGIIFCLIMDFDNAWKTLLGICLGGGLGWLIGLLFSGMWSSVVCLAGALIGACAVSPAALDDISRQSRRTTTKPSDTSSGGKTGSAHYCCQCSHYNSYYHTCDNHGQQYIDPYASSCIAFSR